MDGRRHTHWILSIKTGSAIGRNAATIIKGHTILARRKYFRATGKDCKDCAEISRRRLNKMRCETCGSAIKLKPISSKKYLLNCLKYLERAIVTKEQVESMVAEDSDDELDAEWLGTGIPGNGSSTQKQQDDEQQRKESFWCNPVVPGSCKRAGVRRTTEGEPTTKRTRAGPSTESCGGGQEDTVQAKLFATIKEVRAKIRHNQEEFDRTFAFIERWMAAISGSDLQKEFARAFTVDASTQMMDDERERQTQGTYTYWALRLGENFFCRLSFKWVFWE